MESEKKPRVGVAVMVLKDSKYVLGGKRRGSRGSGLWAFPGGHLEYLESIEDCAKREVREETGLDVQLIPELCVPVINDILPESTKHYIIVFRRALYTGGEPQNPEPERCSGWEWREWDNLPRPLFPGIQKLIDAGYNLFQK